MKNIENDLKKQNKILKRHKQPYSVDYYPELDESPLLDDDEANYYMSQMDAVYNIYGYLKYHDKSTMVFDDAEIH